MPAANNSHGCILRPMYFHNTAKAMKIKPRSKLYLRCIIRSHTNRDLYKQSHNPHLFQAPIQHFLPQATQSP